MSKDNSIPMPAVRKDKPKLEVEFDLSEVTAAEMDAFFKAADANDQAGIAGIYPRVVVAANIPGDLSKPETYLALPYFGTWKALLQALIDEAGGKN